MLSKSDRRQGNAFTVDFLQRLDEVGEPDGAHEADVAGPWAIRPVLYRGASGFAVVREWEVPEVGDAPYAVFRRREIALLAAAVLPATGREPLFRLDTEPDADGFQLLAPLTASANRTAPAEQSSTTHSTTDIPTPATGSAGAAPYPAAGHLRDFDEALAGALNLAAALVRSPVALAWLLEAAGHVAIEQAGRILDRRIR